MFLCGSGVVGEMHPLEFQQEEPGVVILAEEQKYLVKCGRRPFLSTSNVLGVAVDFVPFNCFHGLGEGALFCAQSFSVHPTVYLWVKIDNIPYCCCFSPPPHFRLNRPVLI